MGNFPDVLITSIKFLIDSLVTDTPIVSMFKISPVLLILKLILTSLLSFDSKVRSIISLRIVAAQFLSSFFLIANYVVEVENLVCVTIL